MRATKRVLLYCGDDLRGSRTAFVLKTRGGFHVTQVDCLALLEHALDFNLPFDGAVVLDTGEVRHASRVPVLLQMATLTTAITLAARVVAPGCPMEDLVEAVRMLVSRKRGPSKRAEHITAQRAVAAGRAAVA